MTTKSFPPGHDHSKNTPMVKKTTVVATPKNSIDPVDTTVSPRRLPKSFNR